MLKKEIPSTIVRSLSGLVNYQGLVLGVSDEFDGLFVRDGIQDYFVGFTASKFNEVGYQARKKIKSDHESVSLVKLGNNDHVLAFPSLSRPNRDQVLIPKVSLLFGKLAISDNRFRLLQLFELLSQEYTEVNIEGHFIRDDTLYLLNRGNQSVNNELIKIANANAWLKNCFEEGNDSQFSYSVARQTVDLGSFEGHTIQWTDGIYESESNFLFLATVEKTNNAYDDGEVLCSFMGRFDFHSNRLMSMKKIIALKKAEGICICNSRFLVCIDSDSPELFNEFYSFPLDLLD